jgi:hypothetical protein
MPDRFDFMGIFGLVLVGVGALARMNMNIVIKRSPLPDSLGTDSTELRYRRLIKEQGVPVWPLVVTAVCIPLGIIISFAAIIWSNQIAR